MDALKGLYIVWLWLNKQTGLGRANGTVVASKSFWEEHTWVLVLLFGLLFSAKTSSERRTDGYLFLRDVLNGGS